MSQVFAFLAGDSRAPHTPSTLNISSTITHTMCMCASLSSLLLGTYLGNTHVMKLSNTLRHECRAVHLSRSKFHLSRSKRHGNTLDVASEPKLRRHARRQPLCFGCPHRASQSNSKKVNSSVKTHVNAQRSGSNCHDNTVVMLHAQHLRNHTHRSQPANECQSKTTQRVGLFSTPPNGMPLTILKQGEQASASTKAKTRAKTIRLLLPNQLLLAWQAGRWT